MRENFNMQEDIVNKSVEMFLTYGFKSVTMDEIAAELGISKKTIYQHFENKNQLVETCTLHMFDIISSGIQQICQSQKDPITELYDIKNFVLHNLKDDKASPIYQLQKYFPKIYNKLHEHEFCVMESCVVENLKKGVAQGYYRPEINIDFIWRIYYSSVHSIRDAELFPPKLFTFRALEDYYLEYHLRAIATPKGIDILNQIIHQSNNQ